MLLRTAKSCRCRSVAPIPNPRPPAAWTSTERRKCTLPSTTIWKRIPLLTTTLSHPSAAAARATGHPSPRRSSRRSPRSRQRIDLVRQRHRHDYRIGRHADPPAPAVCNAPRWRRRRNASSPCASASVFAHQALHSGNSPTTSVNRSALPRAARLTFSTSAPTSGAISAASRSIRVIRSAWVPSFS